MSLLPDQPDIPHLPHRPRPQPEPHSTSWAIPRYHLILLPDAINDLVFIVRSIKQLTRFPVAEATHRMCGSTAEGTIRRLYHLSGTSGVLRRTVSGERSTGHVGIGVRYSTRTATPWGTFPTCRKYRAHRTCRHVGTVPHRKTSSRLTKILLQRRTFPLTQAHQHMQLLQDLIEIPSSERNLPLGAEGFHLVFP